MNPFLRRLPWIALAAGMALSLLLVSSIRPGASFSGDAGLKSLMVRQFATGDIGLALHLPVEPWVAELWDAGLYPFEPPFVYETDGERRVAFPPFFAAVSVPFHAAFGESGLYVIPLLSLWTCWLLLLRTLRRLGVGPAGSGLVLGLLALGTPLTLYGALFWEHTLAVTLAFAGTAGLLTPGDGTGRAWRVGFGLLLGLSAWFRPECLCLAGAVLIVGLACRDREVGISDWIAGATGTLLAIGGLVAFNLVTSGTLFGVHSIQVLDRDLSAMARASEALDRFVAMTADLVASAPLVTATLLLLVLAAVSGGVPRPACVLAGVCLLALVSIPAIVPNAGGKQLGPRYLLTLLPVLALAAAILGRTLSERPGFPRIIAAAGLGLALLVGTFENAVIGANDLASDYRDRVPPLLEVVRADPSPVVVVTHQYLAMDLAAVFDRKAVVRIADGRDLSRLGTALHGRGIPRFLLVGYPIGPAPGRVSASLGNGQTVDCSPLGRIRGFYDAWGCDVR